MEPSQSSFYNIANILVSIPQAVSTIAILLLSILRWAIMSLVSIPQAVSTIAIKNKGYHFNE